MYQNWVQIPWNCCWVFEHFELLTFHKYHYCSDRKFIDEQKAAFASLQSRVFKDKQAVYWYVRFPWQSFHVTL